MNFYVVEEYTILHSLSINLKIQKEGGVVKWFPHLNLEPDIADLINQVLS